MVLIRWIEILHSITNVDILKCVPQFLEKFLLIIGARGKKYFSRDLTFIK